MARPWWGNQLRFWFQSWVYNARGEISEFQESIDFGPLINSLFRLRSLGNGLRRIRTQPNHGSKDEPSATAGSTGVWLPETRKVDDRVSHGR